MQWTRENFLLVDERRALDLDFIHGFLSETYWARGISKEVVARSLDHSLCFILFHAGRPIGFARLVTDRATFAYLADVFIIVSYRGKALGRWMVQCIMAHPEVQGLRRWMLATRDAHEFYEELGFQRIRCPERFMEYVPGSASSTESESNGNIAP